MTTTTYRQVKKRHPWRGLFFGFLFGLGLGLMAILYGWYWFGQYTPWILLVLGVILGLLISFLPRPWGNKERPETATMATAAAPPPPPMVEAPPAPDTLSSAENPAAEAMPARDPETYAPPMAEADADLPREDRAT